MNKISASAVFFFTYVKYEYRYGMTFGVYKRSGLCPGIVDENLAARQTHNEGGDGLSLALIVGEHT